MSDIPFDKTVASRHLLDRQLPEFLKELRHLREAMVRIAEALESQALPENKKPEEES